MKQLLILMGCLFQFTMAMAQPNITKVEYFFNTDPGFGNGTPVAITPGADIANLNVSINTTAVNNGLNMLYIRSCDANGKWSLTSYSPFIKTAIELPNIVAAEYFIDTDPGFGNATAIPVTAATDLSNLLININIAGLPDGDHQFFIRSRNAAGNWSVTARSTFNIGPQRISINSTSRKTICGNSLLNVNYTAAGTYNAGNIFNVQLSNASGDFTNPIVIGSSTATAGTVSCTIPRTIASGTGYRLRIISTNPVIVGNAFDTTHSLYTQPLFADTTVFVVCSSETVNLNNVFVTTGFTTSFNTTNTAAAPIGTYRLITSNNVCRDTTAIVVQQDIARWTGTSSNNWHTATNWSTGRVPGDKTHVIIISGTPNPCVISTANARSASIQLRTGAVLQAINSRVAEVLARCATLPAN